jgi:hypothetical protein
MGRTAFIIIASAAALAGSAVALAHNTPYSWTAVKARVMLQEGTNIALPTEQRRALDAELEALLDKFRPLKLTAQSSYESTQNPDYSRLAQTYDTYIDRFEDAQARIGAGLSIDSTKCVGQGKALIGRFTEKPGPIEKRYKHFRCQATSYVLEIPSIEFAPGADPFLPEIVEGPRRLIGPLQAVFTVHVTGKSRMLSLRAG